MTSKATTPSRIVVPQTSRRGSFHSAKLNNFKVKKTLRIVKKKREDVRIKKSLGGRKTTLQKKMKISKNNPKKKA